jgi:hypothetical protein
MASDYTGETPPPNGPADVPVPRPEQEVFEPYRPPTARRAQFKLRARAGGPKAPSRRAFERQRLCRCVVVTEVDDLGRPGDSWECSAVDISRSGIGLRSRRMAYVGRGFLLQIRSGEEKERLLYGVVRQSRYSPGEGHVIGVQFELMPDTLEIRRWRDARGLPSTDTPGAA